MDNLTFKLPDQPQRLSSYLKKYKKLFWIQTVGGVLYNTVIVAGPILLGKAIDAASALYNLGVNKTRVSTLVLILLGYVAVTIFFQYARYIKRWYIRNMSNRIANDMRSGLIEKTLGRDLEHLEKESVGDLMTRTVSDVDVIVSTVQSTINEGWDTWLLMISYFTVLMFYSPFITLICAIPVPVAMFAAQAVRHPLYRLSSQNRKAVSSVTSHLQRTLTGIATLRLFGREEQENAVLKELSTKQMEWSIKTNLLQAGMMPVYSALASLGVVGVIGFGGTDVINGAWTVGTFTAYLSMFLSMSTRTWVAARVFNQFHAAKAAWDRIKEKLSCHKVSTNIGRNNPVRGELVINHLSFSYPDYAFPVLKDISFDIKPGKFIGITGPVGSGKSTLASVLTGLSPYEGSITFDGVELRSLTKEERVTSIAFASQDSFLFSDSIHKNITFLDVPDEKLLDEVLFVSALSDDFELFPEKAETIVGEKGIKLSGGQRQRIVLSRALYTKNPLIILDDPFSALDINTEKKIIQRLCQYLKDATVILFSHRLEAFKTADEIIVMDKGEIKEKGSHQSLLNSGGMYDKIYHAQSFLEGEDYE